MNDGAHADLYARAGVDYATLDAGKRRAIAAAFATAGLPASRGASFDVASYGEPASVIAIGDVVLGLVLECLGTKSLLAAGLMAETGEDLFEGIGYDTVAAAVNDCVSVGALPLLVHAYFATGSADFYDGPRHASIVAGFARGCEDAGAAWGGGESPSLAGLVEPDGIDLGAAALGKVPAGVRPLLGSELAPGDEIVLVASSGLHQNGASLARRVLPELERGLLEPMASGRRFGEALLDPGLIYVSLVEGLLSTEAPLHYCSHLTGHGLRKLMRANRELSYRVHELPPVPEVLAFLAERLGLAASESYGTLNMGAGFALYLAPGAGAAAVVLAERLGFDALVAGEVVAGPREVVLEPFGVTYDAGSLDLR